VFLLLLNNKLTARLGGSVARRAPVKIGA